MVSLSRVWVQSLVRELRSCKPHSTKKNFVLVLNAQVHGRPIRVFKQGKYQLYIFTSGNTMTCWSSQQYFGCVLHFKPSWTIVFLGFQAPIQPTFDYFSVSFWALSHPPGIPVSKAQSSSLLILSSTLDCLVHVFSAHLCTDALAIRFILSSRCSS